MGRSGRFRRRDLRRHRLGNARGSQGGKPHPERPRAPLYRRPRHRLDFLDRDCVVQMILFWLLLIPAVGGALAWLGGSRHPDWPRWIALGVLLLDLLLGLPLIGPAVSSGQTAWIASLDRPWIPQLGISFELDLDGLSLVLILLTIVLGFVSV